MHCSKCGSLLPEQANYCHVCGMRLQAAERTCKVTARQIGEKWSLFGKDLWQFEAFNEAGALVAVSETIIITGFELYGPNEKNRKHKAVFDNFITSLSAAGWRVSGKSGKLWYEVNLSC